MKENFDHKNKIQILLDKYLAGETSNDEEEMLRYYFEEHGDDIPEEWKSFRALFSFVGFERFNFLSEKDSEGDSEDISAEEESIIKGFSKGINNEFDKESNKPQKAKHRNLCCDMAISAAAAIALILVITGIRSIANHSWGNTQPECYAVIDGKVYTNPQKVHDEALDALQGIGPEEQEDAFEALDMMQ